MQIIGATTLEEYRKYIEKDAALERRFQPVTVEEPSEAVSYTHLIIGMGGIASAEDALEFIMAGATAVSVGTANFINPYTTQEVVDGMAAFLERQKVEEINELIGCVK